MSFRKRSVVLSGSDSSRNAQAPLSNEPANTPQSAPPKPLPPGIRPSPLTGVPTTSTGTASLDSLLSGHNGLPLGSLVLIEESSTTDFAGALLRYYTAEGIVQGHDVVVVGVGEAWGRELPGLSDRKDDNEDVKQKKGSEERMKIAWRYEVLGNRRETASPSSTTTSSSVVPTALFCHTYDLTKRLTIPSSSKPPIYIPPPHIVSDPPFKDILTKITNILNSSTDTIVRMVIPNLLSPLIYPPIASHPINILQFIHSIRALTRIYSQRLTVMISLPLSLYPRSSGLIRHIEHLTDTTIELHPVPAFMERAEMRKGAGNIDDVPQGLVRVWKAIEGKKGTGIIATGVGVGGSEAGGVMGMEGGDDLAFMLTRRRMRIERFSLPVDDDDDQEEVKKHNPSSTVVEGVVGKTTKVDLEF